MLFTEMVPEAYEAHPSRKVILLVGTTSFVLMEYFQYWLDASIDIA